MHRWTYDGEGNLLGAPHFAQQPCLDLPRKKLQWNGLLFQGPRYRRRPGEPWLRKDLDFSGHVLNKVEVTQYDFNWKTFIEVYLEDYHVEPFHPGLGEFVDCSQLAWDFGDWYSVQTVGVKSPCRGRAARCTNAGTRWCSAIATEKCRRTARSG